MNEQSKELLLKQMELLHSRSRSKNATAGSILQYSKQMLDIAELIEAAHAVTLGIDKHALEMEEDA